METRAPASLQIEAENLWPELLDCLEGTEWEGEYTRPEIIITDTPCGRFFAGCLARPLLTIPRYVGEVEIYPEATASVVIHEYYHSIISQITGGTFDWTVDGDHLEEVFDPEFACNPHNFFFYWEKPNE